jgi:hypothetical protein
MRYRCVASECEPIRNFESRSQWILQTIAT